MSVKLWFSDFWAGFDTVENKFVRILKKSFDIEVTPKNPDFLIYSVFGNEHYKFRGCIKIFYAGEACLPDFDECDYAATVNPIGFEDRHFQVTFFDMLSVIDLNREVSERLLNRRFCNFIYSNDRVGDGALLRKKFCRMLMEYKQVDCPGAVMNNMKDAIAPRHGDWVLGKLSFIKDYKFTIAFENASKKGYWTEKIFQPFQTNSIPIYWGDPNIENFFDADTFVHVRNYKTLEDAVERIVFLDSHDDAYLNMFRKDPIRKRIANDLTFDEWLVHIFEQKKQATEWCISGAYTKSKLIFEMSMELIESHLNNGNLENAKKYVDICLGAHGYLNEKAYHLIWKVYQDCPDEFLLLLHKQKKMLIDMQITYPEHLRELCAIARCFFQLGERDIAEEIKNHVLSKDSGCGEVNLIPTPYCKNKSEHEKKNNKIEENTDTYWRLKYLDAINGCEWYRKKNLCVNESISAAVRYNYIYPLLQILLEYRPSHILEFGFDQVSKIVAQYAAFYHETHQIVTHDKDRVGHFMKIWENPWDATTVYGADIIEYVKNGRKGIVYRQINDIIRCRKYDFILLKCPLTGNVRIHFDLLEVLPKCLKEDFAIVVDHVEDTHGKIMFRDTMEILKIAKINFLRKDFITHGRLVSVLYSKNWKYIAEI